MKLDGSAVWYLLSSGIGEVWAQGLPRKLLYDYPILYDSSADMSGHVVLVPAHERPEPGPSMSDVMCVSLGEACVRALRDVGIPVVHVKGDVTFQHLYNVMQGIFVGNERTDVKLHTLVEAHAGFHTLLDTCSSAWGFPCALIDRQFQVVCESRLGEDGDESRNSPGNALETDFVEMFMAARSYRKMRESRGVYTVPGAGSVLIKNVFHNDKLVGSLVMRHNGDALSARFVRFLLGYLSPFIEGMYARMGSFGVESSKRDRVKAALEEALQGKPSGFQELAQALADERGGEAGDFTVLYIARSFTNEGSEGRDYLIRRFETVLPRLYGFASGQDLFFFADVGRERSKAREEMRKAVPVVARENLSKVGSSRVFADVEHLPAAMVQAKAAHACGSDADPTSWFYRFDDYALAWLTTRAIGDVPARYVCHPAVPVLEEYDGAHGTELLRTLRVFAECRYNATLAAERLFVARSTLLSRLERIQELVPVDLERLESRVYLGLSLVLA